MADPARARKLAVRIRQIVSAAIEMQIKDPRLGMVTVTDAKVTGDLREATVFYTVYGDPLQVEESARALASATGVLRSTVGKQTGIKFVPTLTFIADVVPDTARELEEALERARHADAELARAREGAQYAGEPDPYRKPAEDDEDDDARRRRRCRLPTTTCPHRRGARHERGRPGSVRGRSGRVGARRPRGSRRPVTPPTAASTARSARPRASPPTSRTRRATGTRSAAARCARSRTPRRSPTPGA